MGRQDSSWVVRPAGIYSVQNTVRDVGPKDRTEDEGAQV